MPTDLKNLAQNNAPNHSKTTKDSADKHCTHTRGRMNISGKPRVPTVSASLSQYSQVQCGRSMSEPLDPSHVSMYSLERTIKMWVRHFMCS